MFSIGLRGGWNDFYLVDDPKTLKPYLQGPYYDLNELMSDIKTVLERDQFQVEPDGFAKFFGIDPYSLYLTLNRGKLIGKNPYDSTYYYLETSDIREHIIPFLKEEK